MYNVQGKRKSNRVGSSWEDDLSDIKKKRVGVVNISVKTIGIILVHTVLVCVPVRRGSL